MINFSIVMRPVNSNLLEINHAKGRIEAAKNGYVFSKWSDGVTTSSRKV